METLRNIPVNIREIRPTFLLSVPALAKNFRKGIEGRYGRRAGWPNALLLGLRWRTRTMMGIDRETDGGCS
jgi:hypothetical protein